MAVSLPVTDHHLGPCLSYPSSAAMSDSTLTTPQDDAERVGFLSMLSLLGLKGSLADSAEEAGTVAEHSGPSLKYARLYAYSFYICYRVNKSNASRISVKAVYTVTSSGNKESNIPNTSPSRAFSCNDQEKGPSKVERRCMDSRDCCTYS